MSKKKFLLIGNSADSILNFRGPLLAAIAAKGLDVHVAGPSLTVGSPYREEMETLGYTVHGISLSRTGKNPLKDIFSFFSIYRLLRQIRPDYVLPYTIKPVIYGTFAAWLAKVPARAALIPGLGYTFQADANRSTLRILTSYLYRLSLKHSAVVFFQNPDNRDLFLNEGILTKGTKSVVVNGSGVDIKHFSVTDLPKEGTHFLLIARLLGDKGIREYVAAATAVKKISATARFLLVGWIDSNPDAISQAELDSWIQNSTIEYLGRLKDVRPAISQSHVYVLPSYHEGTPRSSLEAMAMGRPIITTDAPGCRETVLHGGNGFLVPIRNTEELTAAMMKFIESPHLITEMGRRSREIAVNRYDVNKVNTIILEEMGIN